MVINIKAGGAIVRHLPNGNGPLDVADKQNIQGLLDQIGITSDTPIMVIVNDEMIPAPQYSSTQLSQNDKVALVQPIQAG